VIYTGESSGLSVYVIKDPWVLIIELTHSRVIIKRERIL
jgi:hypothetical protein